VLDEIKNGEQPWISTGTVERKEAQYGFIRVDETGERVFFHRKDIKDEVSDQLSQGDRVTFKVGFTLKGACALAINRL
jgi:cold shock CspA family protein